MSKYRSVNITADTYDALVKEINTFFEDLSHTWKWVDIQYFKMDCAGRKVAIILLEKISQGTR